MEQTDEKTFQIRMPHVAAHESKCGRAFFSEHLKELEQSLDLSLWPAPEKAPTAGIQLIDHGKVLVPPEYGDLVHSDLGGGTPSRERWAKP